MLQYIITPIKSLLANKLRFFLSILGIIVGITSVTVMLGLGEGVKKSMMESLSSSNDVINIYYNENNGEGTNSGEGKQQGFEQQKFVKKIDIFNQKTIEKLEKTITNIKAIVPKSNVSVYPIKYFGKEIYGSIYGVNEKYFLYNDIKTKIGYTFTKNDLDKKEKILVVGYDVVVDNFDVENNGNPVGKKIDLNGESFMIVGILEKSKTNWEANYGIFMPITTAQARFDVKRYDYLSIFVKDINFIEQTKKDVGYHLLRLSGIDNPEQAQFAIQNDKGWIDQIKKSMFQFQLFLGGISGISLFVGGIGIMNIMLVSVTERTREIGIRKALGAKRRNILFQFLTESMIISIVGCLLAFIISIILTVIINYFIHKYQQDFNIYLAPRIFVLSSVVSVIIGLVFGIMPAWKASKLNPITALRFE